MIIHAPTPEQIELKTMQLIEPYTVQRFVFNEFDDSGPDEKMGMTDVAGTSSGRLETDDEDVESLNKLLLLFW